MVILSSMDSVIQDGGKEIDEDLAKQVTQQALADLTQSKASTIEILSK